MGAAQSLLTADTRSSLLSTYFPLIYPTIEHDIKEYPNSESLYYRQHAPNDFDNITFNSPSNDYLVNIGGEGIEEDDNIMQANVNLSGVTNNHNNIFTDFHDLNHTNVFENIKQTNE